ncbi:hypothetical protein ACHAXT_004404 [Thalassiosira profunda]
MDVLQDEPPLRNVNPLMNDDYVAEDHLLLQRNSRRLTTLYLGASENELLPHPDDWRRTGHCLGRNTHVETLHFGSLEGVTLGQFAALCEGLADNQSIVEVEFTCEKSLCLGGIVFQLMAPFFERNLVRTLRAGGDGFEVGLDSETTRYLADALAKFNCLTEFEYYSLAVDNGTALRLFGALAKHKNLEKLYLSGTHHMRRSGYNSLVRLFRSSARLSNLGLYLGFVDDELATALPDALADNSAFRDLSLYENAGLTSRGWTAIATIHCQHSLEDFGVSYCAIDDNAAQLQWQMPCLPPTVSIV